uniref:(northern house mosquito) hypothetical protein n=1 Tax=Culex pipiens TaxID=7175 RepID=A0A8D8EZH9_CULPI
MAISRTGEGRNSDDTSFFCSLSSLSSLSLKSSTSVVPPPTLPPFTTARGISRFGVVPASSSLSEEFKFSTSVTASSAFGVCTASDAGRFLFDFSTGTSFSSDTNVMFISGNAWDLSSSTSLPSMTSSSASNSAERRFVGFAQAPAISSSDIIRFSYSLLGRSSAFR